MPSIPIRSSDAVVPVMSDTKGSANINVARLQIEINPGPEIPWFFEEK